MASSKFSPVDVEIQEPLGDKNSMKPELIMIGEFASILGLSYGTMRRKPTEIFHSFHPHQLQKMLDSKTNTLNFVGNVKTFRIAEIEYRSYIIKHIGQYHDHTRWEWIHQEAKNALKNVELLYFSTNPTKYSRYGPLQFRITYEDAIKQYLEARNRHCKKKIEYKSIGFRVGYTQIFRREINKVVIVCCEEDVNLEEFPKLGSEHHSKHFKPNSDGSAWIELELYEAGRHDELSLAFYLPDNCCMTFPMPKDGRIPTVRHNPYNCHETFKTPYRKSCCPLLKEKRKMSWPLLKKRRKVGCPLLKRKQFKAIQ